MQQFNNIVPSKRQDSPYPHTEPKYGAKQQFTEYDTSAPVGNDKQKFVQKVTGKFNWYTRGVDSTMLTPISALSAQPKPTQAAMRRVQHFLDYAATKEPAVTTYHASDMVLAIHSDAGYLNEARKPWTCDSIGCAIEASSKNNSDFIGARGRYNGGITGRNITPPPITAK